MNKREAKRKACTITLQLIESYTGVGQPYVDILEAGEPESKADKIYEALEELKAEMTRRGDA